jgi:hypothetical protein
MKQYRSLDRVTIERIALAQTLQSLPYTGVSTISMPINDLKNLKIGLKYEEPLIEINMCSEWLHWTNFACTPLVVRAAQPATIGLHRTILATDQCTNKSSRLAVCVSDAGSQLSNLYKASAVSFTRRPVHKTQARPLVCRISGRRCCLRDCSAYFCNPRDVHTPNKLQHVI